MFLQLIDFPGAVLLSTDSFDLTRPTESAAQTTIRRKASVDKVMIAARDTGPVPLSQKVSEKEKIQLKLHERFSHKYKLILQLTSTINNRS